MTVAAKTRVEGNRRRRHVEVETLLSTDSRMACSIPRRAIRAGPGWGPHHCEHCSRLLGADAHTSTTRRPRGDSSRGCGRQPKLATPSLFVFAISVTSLATASGTDVPQDDRYDGDPFVAAAVSEMSNAEPGNEN